MGIIPSFSVSDLVDLIKKGSTLEAQERILQLRAAALDLQEENLALHGKNQELEERIRFQEEFEFDGSVYWGRKADGEKDGPFCQKCKDVDSKRVRLQAGDFYGVSQWHCTNCKATFTRAEGNSP